MNKLMIFAFQSICAQNIEVPVDVLGKGKMLFENQKKTIAYISGYSVPEVGVTLRRSAGVQETLEMLQQTSAPAASGDQMTASEK